MTCKEIENKLIFFIEDNIDFSEKKEISEHLTNCKNCSLKLALLQRSFSFIEKEKELKVNPFISTQILSKIQKKSKKEKTVFIKILQPALVAAFLILAIWIGTFVSKSINSLQTNNYQVQNTQTIDNSVQFAINDISYQDYKFIEAQ